MCWVMTFCARRAAGRKSIADVRRADAIARARFLEGEGTWQQTLRTVRAKLDTTTPPKNDLLLRSVLFRLATGRSLADHLVQHTASCERSAG